MIIRHPFIFSDEKKYRIRRHVAFWAAWWIFQGFLYSAIAAKSAYAYIYRLESSFVESLIYLIPHAFLSYSLMYFVIPRYVLKQKYRYAAAWLILLSCMTAVISATLSLTIVNRVQVAIMGRPYPDIPDHITVMLICLGLLAGLRGGLTIAGTASAIKLMKYWYIKEQRNLQLEKENIVSQLKLLKAQVHPHFLFNTLNNIYSYTQKVSPAASQLIIGLSDLMRYILHEGNKPSVPLSQELKMINDYITLEQVRYGNSLDINKELPSHTRNLHIAPLILLPFVENCFKHGTSSMLDQPWIRLSIRLDGNAMKMTLINSKVPGNPEKDISGIGIGNVRKRLGLLYPGRHQLTITDEEDVYIVNLSIELEAMPATTVINKEINMVSYA